MLSLGGCSQTESTIWRERRLERIAAHAHVSDTEHSSNARAARKTLAMTEWSRRAEKAALVKDREEGNRGGGAGGWPRRNLRQRNKKFEK